ncbi:MAG: hypothetical protein R2706_02355 [Acidimicrobiales bacterium]
MTALSLLLGLVTPAAADSELPSIPTGLTAVSTPDGAQLSWNPSTDDVAVAGYQVYRATSSTAVGTQLGTTDLTSYLVTNR